MNHRDTGITGSDGAVKLLGLALQNDFALIGLIDTGQNLDQSGLTGTVLTDQAMDGTTLNADGNIVQCLNAGELFGDIFQS